MVSKHWYFNYEGGNCTKPAKVASCFFAGSIIGPVCHMDISAVAAMELRDREVKEMDGLDWPRTLGQFLADQQAAGAAIIWPSSWYRQHSPHSSEYVGVQHGTKID